jgi:hypothetical protein
VPQIAQEWKNSGWYYGNAKSPTDIMKTIAKLSTHSTSHRFAWRGFSNANHTVKSTLHRHLEGVNESLSENSMRKKEKSILEEARSWGLGISGGQPVDDLQLLTDLQHFGAPTRLIDVTSNPMTALWFATENAKSKDSRTGRDRNCQTTRDTSGLLLAINIDWYRESKEGSLPQTAFKTIGESHIRRNSTFPESATLEAGISLKKPFIVSSNMPNQRLQAQEGYFISGRLPQSQSGPFPSLDLDYDDGDPAELKKLIEESVLRGKPKRIPFVAILVPAGSKTALRDNLKRTYNKTAKRLFPDHSGFVEYGKYYRT